MTTLNQFLTRARQMNPQRKLFLVGVALLSITGGIGESAFNNFLSDTFNLNAGARGLLEFPRELPGLLTALFAGVLFFSVKRVLPRFPRCASG